MGKRRSQGEGTIYHDASRDRWIGQVWIDGRRRKVSARTKADASAKLGQLLHGDPTERHVDRRLTVAGLLEDWKSLYLSASNRAPGTKEVHRWSAAIITEEIGKVKVSDLDARHVEKMLHRLATRTDRPLSRASLVKVRSTLRQALAWGERRRIVSHNAAAVAELPEAVETARGRRALTIEEEEALVVAMEGHQYAPLWILSLRVGLRPGEAAGVCVDALELDADPPTVSVIRAVRLEGGCPRLVDRLKTARARRTLALPADVAELLRPVVQACETDPLVTAPNGEPVWPSTVRAELSAVAELAHVGKVSPNELRHTAATRMADAGVPPHVIADVLGHSSTRMVDAVYRHRPSVIHGADLT
jgi:integrase